MTLPSGRDAQRGGAEPHHGRAATHLDLELSGSEVGFATIPPDVA